jgi:nitrite reductase/ring-hydroxylating ferredoxin subunit
LAKLLLFCGNFKKILLPVNAPSFIKIAESLAELFNQGEAIVKLQVEGKKICLTQHNQELFAFFWRCPHANGDLSHGYVDSKGCVVCPLHHFKFNLSTGKNITGEGYCLKTYPTLVNDDGVWVGL